MAIDDNTSYELTGAQVKDLANKIKSKAADNIFVGATSAIPGSKGLIPAPQAGDDTKFLSGDGTWKAASAGVNVVQTTGTSTTDVMSQNATTSMVFADPSTRSQVQIGSGSSVGSFRNVAIGQNATASNTNTLAVGSYAWTNAASATAVGDGTIAGGVGSTAIGHLATAGANKYSVALGAQSSTSRDGEVNVGASTSGHGYNNTNYRVLGGVHDPVDAHDAATKGYVDTAYTAGTGLVLTGTQFSLEDTMASITDAEIDIIVAS